MGRENYGFLQNHNLKAEHLRFFAKKLLPNAIFTVLKMVYFFEILRQAYL